MNPDLRKWGLVALAAAVGVVGCGGSGGGGSADGGTGSSGSTGSTGSTGTTGDRQPTVVVGLDANNQVAPGTLAVTYLTGLNRTDRGRRSRAINDLVATLTTQQFTDQYGTIVAPLQAPRVLALNRYQSTQDPLNIPFRNSATGGTLPTGLPSRVFTNFGLSFDRLDYTNPDGVTKTFFREPNAAVNTQRPLNGFTTPQPFNVRARVFPGRDTTIQIFLDENSFTFTDPDPLDATVGSAAFNRDAVLANNSLVDGSTESRLPSFLSDYVRFNISAMPEAQRPTLAVGGRATFLYVSGDRYALSDGAGNFTGLSPRAGERFRGVFSQQTVPGPPGQGSVLVGTYSLLTGNPADPNPGASFITSVQGKWKDLNSVVTNMAGQTYLAISFPSSQDDATQDILFFAMNAQGVATNVFFGSVDLNARTFSAFPLSQLESGGTDGELTGTIEALEGPGGGLGGSAAFVRAGTFRFTAAPPTGVPQTGRFIVFRR